MNSDQADKAVGLFKMNELDSRRSDGSMEKVTLRSLAQSIGRPYCRTKRKGCNLIKSLKLSIFCFLHNLVQLFISHPMV